MHSVSIVHGYGAVLVMLGALLALTGCVTHNVPLPRSPLPPMDDADTRVGVVLVRDRAAEIAALEAELGSRAGTSKPIGSIHGIGLDTTDLLEDWVADGFEAELRRRGYATRQSDGASGVHDTDVSIRFAIESLETSGPYGDWLVVTRIRVRAEGRGVASDEFVVDAHFQQKPDLPPFAGEAVIGGIVAGLMNGARAEFVRAACDRIDAFASGVP